MMGLFSFLAENGRRCSALLGKDNLLIEVSTLFPIWYHLVTFYCSLLLTWQSWHHHYCKDLSFITFYFIISYNFIGSRLTKILCRGRACPNLWIPHLPLDLRHPRCPHTHLGKIPFHSPSLVLRWAPQWDVHGNPHVHHAQGIGIVCVSPRTTTSSSNPCPSYVGVDYINSPSPFLSIRSQILNN